MTSTVPSVNIQKHTDQYVVSRQRPNNSANQTIQAVVGLLSGVCLCDIEWLEFHGQEEEALALRPRETYKPKLSSMNIKSYEAIT